MDALTLLKQQVVDARREFQGVMQDVDDIMAHWQPPGVANPVDDLFLHTVLGEDRQVARLTGRAPVLDEWAAKLNLPPDWRHTPETSRNLNARIDVLAQYAEAVYSAVDAYLASLTNDDLEKTVESFGGQASVASQISRNLVVHIYEHAGEISTIKGLQGAKGYATRS
jgi:hypothetical protein